jgi:hypothetical protein
MEPCGPQYSVCGPDIWAVVTYFFLVIVGFGYSLLDRRMANRNPEGHSPRYWRKHSVMVSDPKPPTEPHLSTSQKLHTLWGSTPFWTGLGVLGGLIVSQFSQRYAQAIVSLVVWFIGTLEVVKIGLFTGKKRIFLNAITSAGIAIVLSAVLYTTWKFAPPTKEPPTLDQQFDAMGRRFPLLASPQIKQQGYVDIGPFQVAIAAPAFQGDPDAGRFMVNAGCGNVGSVEVVFQSCDAEVFIYEGTEMQALKDEAKQEDFFRSFLAGRKSVAGFPRKMIPSRSSLSSYLGPPAGPLIAAVDANTKAVVIVGRVTWNDEIKTTDTDLCEVMQSPFPPGKFPKVAGWHRCLVHEGDQ